MKYTTLEERLYEMNLGINQTSDISLTKYGFSYNMVDLKAGQQATNNAFGIDEMPDLSVEEEEIEIDTRFRINDKIKYKLNKETNVGVIKDVSKKYISVKNIKTKKIDKIQIHDIIDTI